MVGVFYFIKLFQKKKFKTRKCNILVLPVRFINELYILVYYFMWQVVLDYEIDFYVFAEIVVEQKNGHGDT